MATSGAPLIRQIPRAKLYAVFKSDELVQLVEELLYAVSTTLPADTTAVEAALDAHIADTADAHVATAIGAAPGGSRPSNTVQGQLGDLDSAKQAADALLAAIAALVTAADRMIYTTGVDTVALATLTAFARSLLDDADAATARGTLGLTAIAASGTLADLGGLGAGVGTFLATPSSANLRNALTDETGSGAAVFGTSPTISAPVLTGTVYAEQGAQTTKAGAATLTIAELLTRIIEYTGGAANLTLPTGANIDAGILAGLAADRAFDFCVINTGAGTATILTAAGLTLTGAMTVAAGVSAQFRVRKTAASTFTVYRIA